MRPPACFDRPCGGRSSNLSSVMAALIVFAGIAGVVIAYAIGRALALR
jgi:hypothetical protein